MYGEYNRLYPRTVLPFGAYRLNKQRFRDMAFERIKKRLSPTNPSLTFGP